MPSIVGSPPRATDGNQPAQRCRLLSSELLLFLLFLFLWFLLCCCFCCYCGLLLYFCACCAPKNSARKNFGVLKRGFCGNEREKPDITIINSRIITISFFLYSNFSKLDKKILFCLKISFFIVVELKILSRFFKH